MIDNGRQYLRGKRRVRVDELNMWRGHRRNGIKDQNEVVNGAPGHLAGKQEIADLDLEPCHLTDLTHKRSRHRFSLADPTAG
jgi:hypothetical protein